MLQSMDPFSFFWHDYETFGVVPRRDRPAQFAGVRTDADLQEIDEPLTLYCQPPIDCLPDPESCLLTGITPQICAERGVPEHAFAAAIEAQLARPGTVGVGYNSIRFDDEVTRHLFWRNLIDPYAREWQNDCGRWDIMDVARTAYALRPEGIVWPTKEDGSQSFRLEDLARSNGLAHEAAHDALSDVRATIALARLIRERQPKLFDFCLALHKKERVAAELGLPTTPQYAKPFLHISGISQAISPSACDTVFAAMELARAAATVMQAPVDAGLCIKTRETSPQTRLPWKERRKNIRGAFVVLGNVTGRHVVVIDDVLTTGATLNELARNLKRAGAASVTGWVVARTVAAGGSAA